MSRPRKLRSRKAGLPPGSPVHIGEIRTSRSSVSLIDFGKDGVHEQLLRSATDLPGYVRHHEVLWVNVFGLHEPTLLEPIGAYFGLHPLVVEDIVNTDQRQKIESYGNYVYIVLHLYDFKDGRTELSQDQISLLIGRDFVLTFQEQPSSALEAVRQRLLADRGNLRQGGADTLAYSCLDAIVDSYFSIVEGLSEHADALEEQILGKPKPATLEGIHLLKRNLWRLRRNLYPLREVLGGLHRDSGDFFRSDIQLYLRDVYDHTVHILESLEDLRDQATGLLDVYLSTISHRVNLEVRTLTLVATIFMPASLIAGIFGMNFREMPWLDLPTGFSYAMGLMLGVAVVMLLLFWRRRII